MSITEALITYSTNFIGATGYPGVVVLMALESMIAPIPSEAVMPFAGFLAFEGRFSLWGVIAASAVGSMIGSLISYFLGAFGGQFVVHRFGRFLLLREHHLRVTERFFARYGERAVFFSRFIPVVRHLISIPAGVGRMQMKKFLLYTLIGAALWNSILAYVGYALGSNWQEVRKYGEVFDILILIAVCGFLAYTALHVHRRRRRKSSSTNFAERKQ